MILSFCTYLIYTYFTIMSNKSDLENDNHKDYNIGDYVCYETESYNGSSHRYDRYYQYGCLVSNDKYGYSVIKQYGGQIWHGITPISKVSEESFLSKFSIYDEFQKELLKHVNILPTNIKNIIVDKIESKKIKLIHNMVNYVLENKFHKHPFGKIKIDDESWAIEWYVYHVLRMHEPYKINSTITFCYGTTKLLKQFIEENINFMVKMQFISQSLEHIMILLIQEKWLEFLYEKSFLEPKTYMKRLFPIIIKKFETILQLKTPVVDKKLSIFIEKDKKIYEIKTNLEELIGTKIAFTNKYSKYVSNKSSKCHKKYVINLINKAFLGSENIVFENVTFDMKSKKNLKYKSINKPDFIISNESYLSYYINGQQNLIISHGKFTIGSCSCDNYTLYCLKTKKILGSFEFNVDDYDFSHIYLTDIIMEDE